MASQALAQLRAELEQAREVLLPQLEGMKDFARLNLAQKTLEAVNIAISDYERRLSKINSTLGVLADLESDNYPARPLREVFGDLYADLQDNVRTIGAAFSQFTLIDEAVSGEIIFGEPVPRDN